MWKGKDAIFGAISSVAAACQKEIKEQNEFTTESLLSAVVKETKKTNKEYKLKAIKVSNTTTCF